MLQPSERLVLFGKQDVEAPTKADETMHMLLPLAQKMSEVFNRCEDKTVRTELVGLSHTYGVGMARKGSLGCWLMRVLYHMFCNEEPFQAQLGVMAFPEAREWHTF